MKKLIVTIILIASLLCTSCAENVKNTETSSAAESSVALFSVAESSVFSEESSVLSVFEDTSVAEISEETTEDSSEEMPTLNLADITKEIASIKSASFNTNISAPQAAEAVAALQKYLQNSGYGYFYCDLEYNNYISYGCNKDFKTASTSKLPYIKYLCTLADNGQLDLNETMVYQPHHKTSGSGIMKDMATGRSFTIGKLMDYVLRYSDNVAYDMLIERYGLKDYLASVKALGVDYTTSNGYTNCTAAEIAALLYDTALYNGAHLSLMQNAGCNASYNYQIGAELKEYKVLQKYGAMKPGNIAYHDIAVVYAPHPYILVIYTTIDYDSAGKNTPFRKIARLTDDINKALYGTETEKEN